MTVLISFLSILVLHVAAMIYAQDDQSGFISIDCGSGSNYTQRSTGINYVSDDGFIEGGVSQNTSSSPDYPSRVYNTFRSFPNYTRNCYTLRPQKGKNNRYLIRARFFYGDSRGQPPQFDLYIGVNYWATYNILDPTKNVAYEMIHLTSSDYIHVCLVKTGSGYPFITSLELRPLDITMYNDYQSRSLLLFYEHRYIFGADEIVRYKDDNYDRIWKPNTLDGCRAVQASELVSLGPINDKQVPSKVMSTAITPTNSTGSIIYSWDADNNADLFVIYIYLAEVEILKNNQNREVTIYVNDDKNGPFPVSTNIKKINIKESSPYTGSSSYTLIVNATLNSTLPPILNALEIYTLKQFLQNQTDDQDAVSIWSTKSTYGLIKLNWQGDPCVPHAWVGLNCGYDAPEAARIVSLNLSSRGLSGEIAAALANLTMIESLDLSYNNLTGNVPEFLAKLDNLKILNLKGNNFTQPLPAELLEKSRKGLRLSIEESNSEESSSEAKHKISVGVIAFIVIALVVLVLSSFAIVWIVKRQRKKALIKSEGRLTTRKQQFTYSELVSITNNFQNEIGRGGFGRVFSGSIGGNQVAVKILSESSSQGYKEFQAEVKLLMEIHHTNITSLVGYCDGSKKKGIIYEFMANGNLEKQIFDASTNILSWERRLQIGCDAAEGLAYLHHGCRPPIVHRDVKSSNILLNEGFKAKLADFGLSRAFPTEDATHVSSLKIVGTPGYYDPEYTCRLTVKSDVYSFGVVLLELITGRKAILNIVDSVKSAVEEGNIGDIIDFRLDGRFDINTAWKVVEIAIACVSPTSTERPTMNDVVMDLKHCLQAQKTPQTEPVASLNLETLSDPNPR